MARPPAPAFSHVGIHVTVYSTPEIPPSTLMQQPVT